MDNPTTLLVAIMYVTIISIGLSNLLMTLSELAGGRANSPDRVHLSWLILLLFAYLSYFWQTTVILDVDNWRFISFIAFLIGPICLLFATNLLTVLPETEDVSPTEHYMKHSNRFFLLMCAFYAWLVGLDFVADSLSAQTWLAGVIAIFLLVLMASDSYRVHKIGAPAGWVLLLASTALSAV